MEEHLARYLLLNLLQNFIKDLRKLILKIRLSLLMEVWKGYLTVLWDWWMKETKFCSLIPLMTATEHKSKWQEAHQ